MNMSLAMASSPTCTDERVMATAMRQDDPNLPPLFPGGVHMTGGLRTFLEGPVLLPRPTHPRVPLYHDFWTVVILDLGMVSNNFCPFSVRFIIFSLAVLCTHIIFLQIIVIFLYSYFKS